jgi:hypothetical protein
VTHRLTKLFVAAALSTVPVHAFALDFTPDASRILSDPLYLPLQGQLAGMTQYTYSVNTGHEDNALGVPLDSFDIHTNRIFQSFTYGITDDLALGLSDSYDPSRDRSVMLTGGGTTQHDSSGFSDPTVSATWRVLDQNTNPLSLDLLASYTPDLIDSETASPTSDGSVARGGQELSFGAGLGHETRDFTIRAGLNADWYGPRKVDDASGAPVSSLGSFWDYTAGLSTQTRLSDRISLDVGADYVFGQNANLVNHSSGIDFTSQTGNVASLRLGLNYTFVPNRLVIGATYSYDMYGTSRNSSAGTPAADTSVRDQKANIVGAKLDYTFD